MNLVYETRRFSWELRPGWLHVRPRLERIRVWKGNLMRRSVLLVLACMASGCDKPKVAPSPNPTTNPQPNAAPASSAASILSMLQPFVRELPRAIYAARCESNADAKNQKWDIKVVRMDVENSTSALHPLEGVVVVREALDAANLQYNDEFVIRLSLEGSAWRLDQATDEEKEGMIVGRPSPGRAPTDVTDSPLLARAVQIANRKSLPNLQ